jgi:hypothetical protein
MLWWQLGQREPNWPASAPLRLIQIEPLHYFSQPIAWFRVSIAFTPQTTPVAITL